MSSGRWNGSFACSTRSESPTPSSAPWRSTSGATGRSPSPSTVDVLLSADGLRALRAEVLGRGYVEKFPGSRGLRDTEAGVNIDVVLAGEFPGDGKPKPVVFPDPAAAAVRGRQVALLPLPRLIELKLASGMTAPHRLKDLADVLELIRVLSLPRDLAGSLDAWVRPKYDELWEGAQTPDPE